jgi:3',5'-cyclic AMP phosphodiesterase CpdA
MGSTPRTLAHVSDLHIGKSPRHDEAAADLCRLLVRAEVDHVLVTGDITHRGRNAELETFYRIFRPLLGNGRVSVVPGNHDRMGEDAGARLMHGERVLIHEVEGLYLVQVDSTAPHNRSALASHGEVCRRVVADASLAIRAAPANALKVLALHHHLVPLPEEGMLERLSTWMGLPHARELSLGSRLLGLIQGHCDLVLHGHRHVPRTLHVEAPGGARTIVANAGCSTELQKARIYTHADGKLVAQPMWLSTEDLGPAVTLEAAASKTKPKPKRTRRPAALAPVPPTPESARAHGLLSFHSRAP